MVTTKKTDNNKRWQGCRETGTPTRRWRARGQLLWKSLVAPQKAKRRATVGLHTPLLTVCPKHRHVYTKTRSSTIPHTDGPSVHQPMTYEQSGASTQ